MLMMHKDRKLGVGRAEEKTRHAAGTRQFAHYELSHQSWNVCPLITAVEL